MVLIEDLLLRVLNIDLVNELFSLNMSLRKFNDSAATINNSYTESKDALINEKISVNNYLENIRRMYIHLIEIKSFLNSYNEETVKSLAAIRVLAKKRPVISYIFKILPGYKYNKNFESKRNIEMSKLMGEIKKTQMESKEKIDDINKKQ